jgi:hypothetical protein
MHPVSGEMVLMPHSGQWQSNIQYICLITCQTLSNCARLTYLLATKFPGIGYYQFMFVDALSMVLDPKLQAGQKNPRWQPRSRQGIFMGFSNLHSSEVPLVLNLNTGSITPQFHVVFDDHFTTVSSIGQDDSPPNHWADLCLENSISILEDQETSDKSPMSLNDEWLTTEEMLEKQRAQV